MVCGVLCKKVMCIAVWHCWMRVIAACFCVWWCVVTVCGGVLLWCVVCCVYRWCALPFGSVGCVLLVGWCVAMCGGVLLCGV